MTETVRKSVNGALNQVDKELQQAELAQQKPAVNTLNEVYAIHREMSRDTWKSAIYIALTIIVVMG